MVKFLSVTLVTKVMLLVLIDDVVDQAVFFGLLGVHDEVAFHVFLDFFQALVAMLG